MTRHGLNRWVLAVAVVAVATIGCNRNDPGTATTAPGDAPATQQTPVTDSRITTSVQARYQADDALRASDVDVTTNAGVVTLRGTVPSEEAREQAVSTARSVEGVASVNDQLQVHEAQATASRTPAARPSEAPPTATTSDSETTPAWITTKIQAQYFANPEIKPWNIDVTTTSGGVVTLSGEVDQAKDRDEALRIARATEGVTRVEDQLRVTGEAAATTGAAPGDETPNAGEPRTANLEQPDAWVTAKIQAKYFTDLDVKGRKIDVDTRDGVVTLTGEVESEAERRQAVALARNTDGVDEVTDQLQVRASESARGTTGRGVEGVAREGGAAVNDTWITTKIQSKYFLDNDVKGHEINVDSRNGVVTLKGTVESDAQKQTAAQIAQETAGVSRVVNELRVQAGSVPR